MQATPSQRTDFLCASFFYRTTVNADPVKKSAAFKRAGKMALSAKREGLEVSEKLPIDF